MGIGGATQALGDRDRGARTMNINNRTYWYVKKFLAHMVAFRDALEGPVESPVTTYIHGAGKSLQDISRETGKGLEQVSELNKWLLRGRIPSDRVYAVILPGEYRAVQDVVASA